MGSEVDRHPKADSFAALWNEQIRWDDRLKGDTMHSVKTVNDAFADGERAWG